MDQTKKFSILLPTQHGRIENHTQPFEFHQNQTNALQNPDTRKKVWKIH